MFTGAILRTLPCWFSTETRQSSTGEAFLHLGQITNAIAGPMMMAPVSLIACAWFPDSERATATAIGFIANGVGIVSGIFYGVSIVTSSKGS